MVAAEAAETAAADQRQLSGQSESRAKAAAWAWYHRNGGSSSAPAGAGKSEAFATRCAARLAPSRFQREAAMRARLLLASQSASADSSLTSSSSAIDKFSGSSSSFSHCAAYMFGDAADPDAETDIIPIPDHPEFTHPALHDKFSQLELFSTDPAAQWDCGSSLFDSFELVAMAKRLESELREPKIAAQEEFPAASPTAGSELEGTDQQNVLLLSDAPYYVRSPPSSPPPSPRQVNVDGDDIFDQLLSTPDKQSKQAVYDMFCHVGDAAKQVTSKQACKRSSPFADGPCEGEIRKHRHRPGRMSFHGLARALHNITHPYSHHRSDHGRASSEDDCSSGLEIVQDHHHHHHHHLHHGHRGSQVVPTGKSCQGAGKRPSGEYIVDETLVDGNDQRHVHHHHHHHYHYLFHSDDDFRLQPLDKSLVVAAAGLRSSKASPALPRFLESPARSTVDATMDLGRIW